MEPFVPQPLPIRAVDWEALIPLIGRANRSLAQYDGVLMGVPNPEVLLSPLTTQEAVLSSRIEGTQATLGEVLKFEAGEEPEGPARHADIVEILNYRVALRHAETALKAKPFNLNLLLDLHAVLLDSVRGRDKGRGRFRTIQNWIGAPGTPIEKADFIPPDPRLLQGALDDWEKYYHAERPDPLVQLAVLHGQFEIIHPFLDGNGRMGRILIPLFLADKGLLRRPVLYLSAYLEDHRDEYVGKLRALGRDADGWNQWIAFFLRALDSQAKANAEKARAIIALYTGMKERVIALTHSQFAVPILNRIFETPLFKATSLQTAGKYGPTRQHVAHLIRLLRDDGILKVVREGSGRRAQVLAFAELLNLCEGNDAF